MRLLCGCLFSYLVGPCGCDIVNNFYGLPQNVQIQQSFDETNELTIVFLPQSLCAYQYQLQSNATGVLKSLNLSLISTVYAENALACPSLSPYSTPIEQVTTAIAGRPQWYCIVPMPMAICENCIPSYTPQPWNYACQVYTPSYWFLITGQVNSGGNSIKAAAVEGVTIAATIVDENNNPRLFDGKPVTASTVTNVLGNYQLYINSSLLTADSYLVQILPSRTDVFSANNPTVISADPDPSSPSLLALGPGAVFEYTDGSYQTVSIITTTSFSISYDYLCNADVFPYAPTFNLSGSNLTVTTSINPLVLAALQAWNSNSSNDLSDPDIIGYMIENCPGGYLDGCMPGVPQFVTYASAETAATASLINNGSVVANNANASSSINAIPIANGAGILNTTAVICVLANAAALFTSVTVETTTIVETVTVYASGAIPSTKYNQSTSTISQFAWTIPLTYNASQVSNLTNAELQALSQSYRLNDYELQQLVDFNNTAPFLMDSTYNVPVFAGNRVNPDGSLTALSATDPLILVIPYNNSLLTPLVVNSSVSTAGIHLPQWVQNYNPQVYSNAAFLLDNNVETSPAVTNTLTQTTTVIDSDLVSVSCPASASVSNTQIRLTLSSEAVLYLPMNRISITSPLVVMPPPAVGDLTYTDTRYPITLTVDEVPTYALNVTTGQLYNYQLVNQLEVNLPSMAAIVDYSHTLSSYISTAVLGTSCDASAGTTTLNPLSFNASVVHVFETVGINPAGSSITLPATLAQTLSTINFNDVSVQSVFGTVYIGPVDILPGIDNCGMPNIVITAYNADDTAFLNPIGQSSPTGDFGTFSLTVPIDEPVVLVPSYVDASIQHLFYPSKLSIVTGPTPVYGLIFYDIQLHDLTVSLVGGQCEASIAPGVNPLLIVDSCASKQWVLPAYSKLEYVYSLPAISAHVLSYAGTSTTGVEFDAANGMTAAYQDELNSWLLNNGQIVLNLTAGDQTVNLVYYNSTQVALEAPNNDLPCYDSNTGTSFTIWASGSSNFLSFYLWEQYSYGVYAPANLCRNISSNIGVFLYDQVSDDTSKQCVTSGCILATTYFDGFNTVTNYSTIAGQPYIFQRVGAPDYTAEIRYGIAGSTSPEANVLYVVVTGSIATAGVGVVPMAPQTAQYILRDPPGGNSYATLSTLTVSTSAYTTTVGGASVATSSKSIGGGVDEEASTCEGEFVEECEETADVDDEVTEDTGTDSSSTSVNTDTTTTTQSFTLTASTSNSPSVVDGNGDLFLLATTDMTYTMATVLQASILSASQHICQVTPPYPNVVYTQSPLNYLTWFSAATIQNTIIPSIQNLINALVNQYSPTGIFHGQVMSKTDQNQLITLQTQLIGWQALITQNEMLKLNAQPWPELLGGTVNWNINDVVNEFQPAEKFLEQLGAQLASTLVGAAITAFTTSEEQEIDGDAAIVTEEGTALTQDEKTLTEETSLAEESEDEDESFLAENESEVHPTVTEGEPNGNSNPESSPSEEEQLSQEEGQVSQEEGEESEEEIEVAGVETPNSGNVEEGENDAATEDTALEQVSKWSTFVAKSKTGVSLLGQALLSVLKSWIPGQLIKDVLMLVLQEVVNLGQQSESGVSFGGGEGIFSISMSVTSTQQAVSSQTQVNSIKTGTTTVSNDDIMGVDAEIKTVAGGTASNTISIGSTTSTEQANTLTIYLGDPDQGDLFDVIIRRDTVFGSPVYITMSGQSRCPPEAGTIQREMPNMAWQSSSAFQLLNPYDVTTAILVITSNSGTFETFSYTLNINSTSNTGGLSVSANGVQLGGQDGVTLSVAYGGSGTFVLISFQRLSGTGYVFDDLQFILSTAGSCSSSLTTTFSWSVSYTQPCSEIAWAGPFAYASTFTINLASVTQSDGSIPVVKYAVLSITNPEMNIVNRSWIEVYKNGILSSGSGQSAPFLAEFLPLGASAAQWEILTGDASLDSGSTIFNPLSVSQPGNDFYTWAADVSALNGYYQFKVVSQCNQPINGAADPSLYSFTSPILTGLIDFNNPSVFGSPTPSTGQTWSPNGPISTTFNEDISCQSALFNVSAFSAPTLELLQAGLNLTAITVSGSCSGASVSIILTGSPNWSLLSGSYMAVAVEGIQDVAGNPTADSSPISWSFPVAVYDATHSTVDLSNLAFFPNTAQLLAAVEAARSAANNATTGRRLLQVGGGSLPITSTPTVASQLSNEVVSVINLYMSLMNLGPSGLNSQSVSVRGLTPASAVATLSFQYTPPSASSSIAITPSLAARYFDLALQQPSILTKVANATLFPLLSQSVVVNNLLTASRSNSSQSSPLSTGAQALSYSFNAINVKANPQVLLNASSNTLIVTTSAYNASIDFALAGGSSSQVAQITFSLQLFPAGYGPYYDSINSLLLTYQVIPDPTADPDIIANTDYPVTVVNSSDPTGALSVFNELGGTYYIALLSIPTQPGGINYSISLTDWQHSNTPFFSQTLFIMGPPSPPILLAVCQSSLLSLQLAYLPSMANGLTAMKGNLNVTYQPVITIQANSTSNSPSANAVLTVPVPVAAISSSNIPSWCIGQPSIPCSQGYCPPATAYIYVNISAIPAVASILNTTGVAQYWNLSLSAQNSIALTVSSSSNNPSNPITISTLPSVIIPSKVLQLTLDVFQLTFIVPANGGSPIMGWNIGYTWSPTGPLSTDPSAPATVQTPLSSHTVNSTCNLTITSLLQGPITSPFYVFIQAVNAYGASPIYLHLAALPVYLTPPTNLTIIPQPSTNTAAIYLDATSVYQQVQNVIITYGEPLLYSPSASMAMGYEVTVLESNNVTGNLLVSSSAFRTWNTSLSFSWLLFSNYTLSVSSLMNSTNNPAKLCTPGSVAIVASLPVNQTLTANLPVPITQVSINQWGAEMFFLWPQATTPGDTAFNPWFVSSNITTNAIAASATSPISNVSTIGNSYLMTSALPVSISSPSVLGTVIPYLIGLQTRNMYGWGPVIWSNVAEASAWILPSWGQAILALPLPPSVTDVLQLTADPVSNTAAITFNLLANGYITPLTNISYSISQCVPPSLSNQPYQLVAPASPSILLSVPQLPPYSLPIVWPSLSLSNTYCIEAFTMNEAGSSSITQTVVNLESLATFGGSTSPTTAITGAYLTSPSLNLNQDPSSNSIAISGTVTVSTIAVTVSDTVIPAPYSAMPSSSLSEGDDFMNAVQLSYSLNGNISLMPWLPSTFPAYANPAGMTASSQVIILFTLQKGSNNNVVPYNGVTQVSVMYQPLPDPDADPDLVAETVYPATVSVSHLPSNSAAPFNDSNNNNNSNNNNGTQAVLQTPAGSADGFYLLTLSNVASQPGGVNYWFSITDLSQGPSNATAFINITVFVGGPPDTPYLVAINQPNPNNLVLTYLPSTVNGVAWHSGNIGISYNLALTDLSTDTVYMVPPDALTPSSLPVTAAINSLGSLISSAGSCHDSAASLSVDLSQVPGLSLPSAGTSKLLLATLTAESSLASSAPSSYPIDIHSVPPSIPIPVVIPIALNEYRITFVVPPSIDAVTGIIYPPIIQWLVGYTFNSSSNNITVDPIASANVVTSTVSSDVSDPLYGLATEAGTTVVTTPFPAISTPFFLSVQAVNILGPSAIHLHLVTPAFVSSPNITSIIQLQGDDGDQRVNVTFTGATIYQPNPAIAVGYQLLHSPAGDSNPIVALGNSTYSTIVSGLPLSNPVVTFNAYSVINSSLNKAKECTPGAINQLLSAPNTVSFPLIQPAQPPTVTFINQTSTSSVLLHFTPSDGESPASGQAIIRTYRAEYIFSNANINSAGNSNAALLAFNNRSVIPSQSLSAAPYSSSNSLITNTIIITDLPVTAAGSTNPMLIGVTAYNIAGWGYPALIQLPNGLLGLPLPPSFSFNQLSATQTGANTPVAVLTTLFTVNGVLTPGYSLTYTYVANNIPLSLPQTVHLTAASLTNGSVVQNFPSLPVMIGGSNYSITAYTSNEIGSSSVVTFIMPVASVPVSPLSLNIVANAANQTVSVSFASPAPSGGSNAVILSYVILWYSNSSNTTFSNPIASVSIAPVSPITIYTVWAASLPNYVPGFVSNYTFAIYSISQYGSSILYPDTQLVAVSTESICCVRFAGSYAYPSFTVPTTSVGSSVWLTITSLENYDGSALPWYGNRFLANPYCYDYGTAGPNRLEYFDPLSGNWYSNFTFFYNNNWHSWTQTNAFQMNYNVGNNNNNLLFFNSWDLYVPLGPQFLTGKVLRMPLKCNLGAGSLVNTCVEFTVNSPQSQLTQFSWTSSQLAQCAALMGS